MDDDNQIIEKIDRVDELTESQRDRMSLPTLAQNDFANLISEVIHDLHADDPIKRLMKDRIAEIVREDKTVSLLAISDVLDKFENRDNAKLLGLLELFKKQDAPLVNMNIGGNGGNDDMSKEDVQEAKEIMKFMKDLKYNEFPQ